MKTHGSKIARPVAFAAAVLAALFLGACGSEGSADVDPGSAAEAPRYEEALARAPAKLTSLYDLGGGIAEGGLDGLERQLEDLRGYPVVVNNWASWCGPCRAEWPHLQRAADEHLDEVAFVGVDSQDSYEAATTYLESHPVPYPSFADPGQKLNGVLDTALVGVPNTLFLDRSGKVVYSHQGPYADAEALNADIEKYALDS